MSDAPQQPQTTHVMHGQPLGAETTHVVAGPPPQGPQTTHIAVGEPDPNAPHTTHVVAPTPGGGTGTGLTGGLTDPQASFVVHLDSLTKFARELEYQVSSLGKPENELASVDATPMRLGEFTEAHTLQTASSASAKQLLTVLGEVKAAMEFAREVTTIVARGYEQADSDVAASLGMGVGSVPGSSDGPKV